MFNDIELLIIQTIVMRLNEKESLAWLEGHGHEMKSSTFYKYKKNILGSGERRKIELDKEGLWEQHLRRIDQLETVEKLSWENYHRLMQEKKFSQAQRVLECIARIQPMLSTYYHASHKVLEFDKNRRPTRYLPVRKRGTDKGSTADNE